MKSIVSIAALVAMAGTSAAQMQSFDPNRPVDGHLKVPGIAIQKNMVRTLPSANSGVKATLAGDTYSTVQNVYSDDPANGFILGVPIYDGSSDNVSEFSSDGTTPGAFGPFDGIQDSPNNVFFDAAAADWADSVDVPAGTVVNNQPLGLIVLDIDNYDAGTGVHELILRHWNAGQDVSVGGGVFQFAPSSANTGPDTDQTHNPIVIGFNDSAITGVDENATHPIAFGFGLGVDGAGTYVDGLGLVDGSWDESAGVDFDPDNGNYWNMLCFSDITGLFFRITLTTDDDNDPGTPAVDLVPDSARFENGEIVFDNTIYFPGGNNINLVTGGDDVSLGFGPFDLTANGGVPGEYFIPAGWQMIFKATEDTGSGACTGDVADAFGNVGTDGGGNPEANPDGVIDFGDFLALLGLGGPCGAGTGNPNCVGDFADSFGNPTPDGQIEFGDFLFLLGAPCP